MPSLFLPVMTTMKMPKVARGEPSDPDFELVEEIQEGIDFEHAKRLLLIHRLVMLSRKVRVDPPPQIVSLQIRSTQLLLKIVESVHLFHRALDKSR
jgi:hypothetical protein